MVDAYASRMAMDKKTSKDYVLKPSLEGGGHNIYGRDIPSFLARIPKDMWRNYILMKKITSPPIHNHLMSPQDLYTGPVISELGVFGVCLWKKTEDRVEILDEKDPCWSFKAKSAGVDEMSVVKGYGCFDSPALVELETFDACKGGK